MHRYVAPFVWLVLSAVTSTYGATSGDAARVVIGCVVAPLGFGAWLYMFTAAAAAS
jgi:hypothetical protein